MTVVAFDIGDKRVGVAFSDPAASYAVPSDTYFRTGDPERDAAALAEIAKRGGAERIVCGLPLHEDGSESVQSQKTRRFCALLREKTELPVEFADERNSTRAARADLIVTGRSAKRDKKQRHLDSLAAAYILEGYLEERRNAMKEESNNYEDENIVTLTDDEGNTYRYEHLMTFEYKGEWYCALTPERPAEEDDGEDDEDDEVAIYHLVGGEDDEQLETIEDEAALDEVFAEFCRLYEDFEDADEAERLDSDED